MFGKLMNIGIYPELSFKEQTKIRIFNTSCIVISCINVLYIIMSFFQELYLVTNISIFELFIVAFCIYLNHLKKYLLAFHIGMMHGILFVFVASLIFGQPNHTHIYFLFMPVAALIVFDNKKTIMFYFFLSMLFLVGTKLLFNYSEPYYPGLPMGEIFGFMNLFFTGMLIYIGVRQFKNENGEFIGQINFQRQLIEEKNKDITDSINYAKGIQRAILPDKAELEKILPQSFILFKPKDIVSGDFYWATSKENDNRLVSFYLAVCDSTGHGVPGAFMSLLNISFLNEAITEKNIEKPNEVFDYVRKKLIVNISQGGGQDGMDGILCKWEMQDGRWKMDYAAAHNAPLLIQNGKIVDLPYDKMPIGKTDKLSDFRLFNLELNKGDTVYLFTDGYADQFGGPLGKKFKYKQLQELLLSIHNKAMDEQRNILEHTIDTWKAELEQVDDICMIGIRV